MNEIGWAVKQMRNGQRVARQGWNGKGMWLVLINPSQTLELEVAGLANPRGHGHTPPVQPFVVMRTAQGALVPWLCSQTDLLATDWDVAPAAERHSPLWENARTGAGQEAKMAAQTTEG